MSVNRDNCPTLSISIQSRRARHARMLDSGVTNSPRGSRAKQYGAYYTGQSVAEFLVAWALRKATDRVIDPSFGGGVFLEAVLKRLKLLGEKNVQHLYGAELDSEVHAQTAAKLSQHFGIDTSGLIQADFFALDPSDLDPFDAVVGNPPFIRYQRFSGAKRQLALHRASEQGVVLSKLVSSWAPFLIHSCALLKPGGRLGMVIPTEIGHAAYARPVLDFVVGTFKRTTLLTFKERLFPELSQDTLLLLAEDKGNLPGDLYTRDVNNVEGLEAKTFTFEHAERIDARAITSGRCSLPFYLLPGEARSLYQELAASSLTRRLGDMADVGTGYVTGANRFFHLGRAEAEARNVANVHLKPAVYRGRALKGLLFTQKDWGEAEENGEAGYLLSTHAKTPLPASVTAYIDEGEKRGIDKAYKCRIRSPWYAMPHVYPPDAFLSYMSGSRPHLVANAAGAVAPNSLHIVRLRPGSDLQANELALLWQTSLTSLSVELEGHALGGGMLKLEPGEARRVLLPNTRADGALLGRFDTLARRNLGNDLARLADRCFLQERLGISSRDCDTLFAAAALLRDRRRFKTSSAARSS